MQGITSVVGKILIVLGAILAAFGLVLALFPRIPFFGRLPGDLDFKLGETRILFPLATCILVSIFLTILANLLLRLFK